MEIAPGVHAIRLLSVYAFLISEPRMTLIDTGLIGSRRRVERYVQRIGRSMDEIGQMEVWDGVLPGLTGRVRVALAAAGRP